MHPVLFQYCQHILTFMQESVYQDKGNEETIMEGRIPVGVYVKYFRAGGGYVISLFVFLIAIISRVCIF